MLFIRLINSSFKRNLRTYGPYLLATCMLVAINYIFTAIAANHSLKALSTGKVTTAMMKPGAAFILMVTAAFLLYVNHFLWQQRSREIGLYSMLGMTSRNRPAYCFGKGLPAVLQPCRRLDRWDYL